MNLPSYSIAKPFLYPQLSALYPPYTSASLPSISVLLWTQEIPYVLNILENIITKTLQMQHLSMQFSYTECNKRECGQALQRSALAFQIQKEKSAQSLSALCSDTLLEGSHTHPLMCSGPLPFGKCCFIKGTIPQKCSL